ncbi:hypothetical protein ORV05_10170 [Amycolatopsis cynarae]|uniref:Uncharacterized protein n=1 Tax=Amycolatopsis cynarae TaxID=2995223 RepID=A0ABY7B828_9PSEU|nr:hypothetical protein [Amycolatopsis sp. HUAS 11-8]WAL68105.1 hypothetical protein ORV05_10170 [Amycolatopsis sp. HUAS 11-8]
MFGKRSLWPYLAGAAAVLAVVVFALVRLGEPDLVPVPPASTSGVTIAGQLSLTQTGPDVSAHLTVSADRAVTLRGLTVKVRDRTGAFHDFPELANIELTTVPRELVLNGHLSPPGEYTYYLAYRLGGDWVSLPPWQSITIR